MRRLKLSGKLQGAVTVRIKEGTYYRNATFSLGAEDSGTVEAPIRYCGVRRDAVHFMGGVRLEPGWFQPVPDNALLERIPARSREAVRQVDLRTHGITEYGELGGLSGGLALFCDDQRLPLARWPNSGWAEARSAKVEGLDETAAESLAKENELGNVLKIRWQGNAPRPWQDLENVWIRGVWQQEYWQEAWHPKDFAPGSRELTMEFDVFPAMSEWRRFYAANVVEEMDAHGEWVLDRTKGILYIIPPSESAAIYASMLESPLIACSEVSHVTIEGLTFEATRGVALVVNGGAHVHVQDCTIRHAAQGIHFSNGINNGAAQCRIYDLDASGVQLSGGDRRALTPAGLYAEDNDIHHFGQLLMNWQPGVKVVGVGNRVMHNNIHHGPQYAVHYEGNDHVFEYNDMHDVCLEMSDVGVIGCGTDWTFRGNVIRHNFIHDIPKRPYPGVVCVYLDNCASSADVIGNVFFRVPTAVMIGGGRDNRIENNIFVECRVPVYLDNRGLRWGYFREGGEMYDKLRALPYNTPPWSDRYPALARIRDEIPQAPLGNMLIRNISIQSGWKNPEEVCRGMFKNNIPRQYMQVRDNFVTEGLPTFVDISAGSLVLRNKPAQRQAVAGFRPIPFEEIGPRR